MKITLERHSDTHTVAFLNGDVRTIGVGENIEEAVGDSVLKNANAMGILIVKPDGDEMGSENQDPSYSQLLEENRRMKTALEALEKEMPAAISYAEMHGLKPDFGGSAVHIVLWRCQSTINDGLGNPSANSKR